MYMNDTISDVDCRLFVNKTTLWPIFWEIYKMIKPRPVEVYRENIVAKGNNINVALMMKICFIFWKL